MIKEKLRNIKNKIFKDRKLERQKKKIIFSVILVLAFFNIFLLLENYNLNQKIFEKQKKEKLVKIDKKYFGENLKLNDYSGTKYKITNEGKQIIKNIKDIHKSPVLIAEEHQNKELCAGYIVELSKKIWGKKVVYSIGMQNTKKHKLAQAWELPYFYEAFGGKVMIDLGKKFDLSKKDYLEKIGVSDLKEFFAKAFSEEALFGDIGFLYSKTKYTNFLKGWNANSHITKNMGVSDFEVIISKFDKNKTSLENYLDNLGCSEKFLKYKELLENYESYLNGKRIVFYNNDFYYLNHNSILNPFSSLKRKGDNGYILGNKIKLKYLDKITYKDITIAHFFEGKSHVDSLLQFSCKMEFYPINVMSINGRMIEKI